MVDDKPNVRDYLGNKSLKIGAILIVIALILAVVSINRRVDTLHKDGPLPQDEFVELGYRGTPIESTLLISPESPGSVSSCNLTIYDYDFDVLRHVVVNFSTSTLSLYDHEFKLLEENTDNSSSPAVELSLTDIAPGYVSLNELDSQDEEGLTYEYKLVYSIQPYRILSIPAFVFTMVGVVFFMRGRFETKQDVQMERKGRERYGEQGEEEKSEDV